MMTLWCMMRSPLMIGSELTRMDDFTVGLLTNAALLEIEKATYGAHPLYTTEEESAWVTYRRDGDGMYAALFNLSDEERTLTLTAAELERGVMDVEELWTSRRAEDAERLTVTLSAHDAAVWRIR